MNSREYQNKQGQDWTALGPVLTILASLAVAGNIPLSVFCGKSIHFYTEEL
jgi:hypothetical protein